MIRLSTRQQRTVARPAEVRGVGFITGSSVRLRFLPAPPSTGVVFVRTDLRPQAAVPAHAAAVTATDRRTTLGAAGGEVTLVEHVLAALAGLRIDNCRVELDGPEPPGLDGSAAGFFQALGSAGAVVQDAPRPVWTVDRPVVVEGAGATIAVHPSERAELRVTYFLDYGPAAPIAPQRHTEVIESGPFGRQIAPCRTFVLEEEARELRARGLGSRTGVADLLVFGRGGPIGNRQRFANEPARHKVLDVVGDLSLAGGDVRGHVIAYRSGHALNVELARRLAAGLAAAGAAPARRAA